MPRSFNNRKITPCRKPKPLLVLFTDVENMRQSPCYQSFLNCYTEYNIRLVVFGSLIGPANMLKKIELYWVENGMSRTSGDIAYLAVNEKSCGEMEKFISSLKEIDQDINLVVADSQLKACFNLHGWV